MLPYPEYPVFGDISLKNANADPELAARHETKMTSARTVAMMLGAVLATAAHSQRTYTLTELGALVEGSQGIGYSRPNSINDSGDVVGLTYVTPSKFVAYKYSAGVMQSLGMLGGGLSSEASDINSSGVAVGYTSYGSDLNRAFKWSSGEMEDLASLQGLTTGARGINNSGVIVGSSRIDASSARNHAFVYADGVMTDIGTLPGASSSAAFGINEAGQIVGVSVDQNGSAHAFLYSNGIMRDIGDPSVPAGSIAFAINNLGDAVGSLGDRAMLYSQGVTRQLESLHSLSIARDINDSREIVGNSVGANGSVGFVYSGSTMYDLNTLIAGPNFGWHVQFANSINNSGQIAAVGVDAFGRTRSLLLTPVPEPTTLTVLGLPMLALFRKRRLSVLHA